MTRDAAFARRFPRLASGRLPWLAAGWALLYGAYRGYYALGGTIGMFGTPVSQADWRLINGIAAVVLVIAAGVAAASPRIFADPRGRLVLLAVGWVITVGCVMHALVDWVTRLLSLAGLLRLDFPFFATVDRRASDLQDVFLNEPWFFVEGLLWGALCWLALRSGTGRRRFVGSALAAIALLTAAGILSATGVTGRLIIG